MIPESAVEALARFDFESEQGEGEWDSAPEQVKPGWTKQARLRLEAAAPHMLAEAWDEGYKGGKSDEFAHSKGFTGYHANPYR